LGGVIEMQKKSKEVVTIKKIQSEVNRVLEKHKSSTDAWYTNRFLEKTQSNTKSWNKSLNLEVEVKGSYA
jgi:hypothetical protein